MFKLMAEFEGEFKEFLGTFSSMEEAEKFIVDYDNSGDSRLEGADCVLTNEDTAEQWLYTDRWEKLEDGLLE